jgi:hypothetical protein
MPNDVQLLGSPTKSNRNFDTPAVLMRKNFFSFSVFFSLNNGPKKLFTLFSLKMHYNVQLLMSSTKSNRSFDVPALLICQNFSSPMMQTASSAEAMPSPASLLAFARLDVNPGRQLCKLKHPAAQIETKIASAPRIEGWESGSRRGKRRRTDGGGSDETDILLVFSVG